MRRARTQSSAQMHLAFGSSIKVAANRPVPKKKSFSSGDWLLIAIVLTLTMIGLIMVYNASSLIGQKTYQDSLYFIKRQLAWFVLGTGIFFVCAKFNLEKIRKYILPLAIANFLLLLSVLAFGVEINGARRWLHLGGLSIQPSELAKLFTVFYLAHYIDKKAERLCHFLEGVLPALIVTGLMSMLILLEPDFGTTLVLLSITMILLLLGGVPIKQLALVTAAVTPFFVYWVMTSPYRMKRILSFLDPWESALSSGFQVIQSQVALGSGGLTGNGLTGVKQVLFFLPEPHTDFIFSVYGEAFGLIGTTVIVLLYAGILWRGTRTAFQAPNAYKRTVAFGMTLIIVLPALLNMGVATGMLPTKGLPLPFMSYGGSSLFTNSMAAGFLYNISQETGRGDR